MERQEERNRRAMPLRLRAGAQREASLVFSENAIRYPQTEPDPGGVLGGEERLEDAFARGFRNAAPGIGHRHANAA